MKSFFQALKRAAGAVSDSPMVGRIGLAILEVFCVGILGILPLVAAPFLNIHDPQSNLSTAMASFGALIHLGQLFLYSFSLIGTLFWLLFARSTGAHVVIRVLLGMSVFLIGGISLVIFMQDPFMRKPLPTYIVYLSIGSFISCLTIYFLLLICNSGETKTVAGVIQRDVQKLIKSAESKTHAPR